MSNLQQYFNSNVFFFSFFFFFKLHRLRCNTLNFKGDMTRGKGQFFVEAITWCLYSHLLSAAVESSKFHQGTLTITKR